MQKTVSILGLTFLIISICITLFEFLSTPTTTTTLDQKQQTNQEEDFNTNELEMSSSTSARTSTTTNNDAEKAQRRAARESEALKTGELITRKEAMNRKFASAAFLGATAIAYAVKGATLLTPAWWSVPVTMGFATALTGYKSV